MEKRDLLYEGKATQEEIHAITKYAFKVNEVLKEEFAKGRNQAG